MVLLQACLLALKDFESVLRVDVIPESPKSSYSFRGTYLVFTANLLPIYVYCIVLHQMQGCLSKRRLVQAMSFPKREDEGNR